MEARNRSLPDWLTRIRTRQIALPRFQRFEAWGYSQVENLLNTVMQGLPSGALLTLEVGGMEKFVSRPIVTAPKSGENVTEHLLDGQQRLTALWRSLNNTYEDRTYVVKIIDQDAYIFDAMSIGRYEKKGQLYPLWASDPAELWKKRLIPVSLLRPGGDAEAEGKQWAKQAVGEDFDSLIEIHSVLNTLRNKFHSYNIPFLSLPATTEPEVALNVFIQMNTSSSPLTSFDIVVAQLEASTGKSLHGFVEDLKSEIPNVSRYEVPGETLLAVAALLSDQLPSKGTYLHESFAESFVDNWNDIKKGIRKAVAFLSDERIFDAKRLPTEVVLPVIASLWAKAPEGLDKEGDTRLLIRRYMWRSFFTNRYDQSTNTRAFADYKELQKMIAGTIAAPDIFDENSYPIASTDDLLSAGWPSRKDRLARAVLAVTLKAGGFDFADGAPATFESIQNREYHHIFPVQWLKNSERREHEINRAVNCSLISWKTNRNISDKAPSKYVAERMARTSLGDDDVKRRLESHLVPVESLINDDFDEFIRLRTELIHQQIVKLCDGTIFEPRL